MLCDHNTHKFTDIENKKFIFNDKFCTSLVKTNSEVWYMIYHNIYKFVLVLDELLYFLSF